MSARTGAAGLVTTLVLGAAAAAAEPPSTRAQTPKIVTNPDWIEKPSGEAFASVYPAAAQLLMIPGHALLGCQVAISGDLEGCRLIEETPKGEGFGAAAMLLTPRFKMRPMVVNGTAVAGARVNIPIAFQVSAPALPTAPANAPAPGEPSPRALALAERIVAASVPNTQADVGVAGYAAGLERISRTPIDDPGQAQNRDAALADLFQALVARRAALRRARVVSYARSFSESELAGIADFLESPAGHAFVAKAQDANRAMEVEAAEVIRGATADARAAYCAARDCGPALAHAPAAK